MSSQDLEVVPSPTELAIAVARSNDFDASQSALQFLSSGGDVTQLSLATADIERQVRNAVSERWRPLLGSAETLASARSRLKSVSYIAQSLTNSVLSLQAELREPLESLRARRDHLNALITAASLLRSLQRFLQLITKLRSQLGIPQELPLAASALTEMTELMSGTPSLARISVVSRELPLLRALRSQLILHATRYMELELGLPAGAPPTSTDQSVFVAEFSSVSSAILTLVYLAHLTTTLAALKRHFGSRMTWIRKLAPSLHSAFCKITDDGESTQVQYFGTSWSSRQFSEWAGSVGDEVLLRELESAAEKSVLWTKERFASSHTPGWSHNEVRSRTM